MITVQPVACQFNTVRGGVRKRKIRPELKMRCFPTAARLLSRSGNEFAVKQGIAVMKKKPASVPEIPKTSAAKTERTSKTAAKPVIRRRPKVPLLKNQARAPRKPLLDVAVDTVKKMLKPKPAAQEASAKKPPPSKEPKRCRRKNPWPKNRKWKWTPPRSSAALTRAKRKSRCRRFCSKAMRRPAAASGPGEKFSLGATPPAQSFSGGELPESYGTKKLFLTARDPALALCALGFDREQQKE
jgi:hypothetical protein